LEVGKKGDENTKDDSDKSDKDLSLLEDAPVFSEIDIVLGQDDSLFPLANKVWQHQFDNPLEFECMENSGSSPIVI